MHLHARRVSIFLGDVLRRLCNLKRMIAIGGLLLGLGLTPARAIFGLGDIVFDPTNYLNAIEQLVQLQQEYAQLVRTYEMVRNQYDQMLWMARRVPVTMIDRYRTPATSWRTSTATNISGVTTGWMGAINVGSGVLSAYQQATQPLIDADVFGSIPAAHRDRFRTNYASVELADGANVHEIETIGRLRANATAVATTIRDLEADSLSSDPAMNTEIAVLNKINAANIIALRNAQDTNQLLVAVAEQQVIAAKRTRDAEAQAINNHIRFAREGKTAMASQGAGASEAMRTWRMP